MPDEPEPCSPIDVPFQFPAARRPRPKPPALFAPRVTLVSSLHDKEPEPVEWIAEGLVPKKSVTLLAGRSNIGKTFLCQIMMTACAVGKPFFGRNTRRCKSFALFSEDVSARLQERQLRICTYYDMELLDLEEMMAWIPDDDGNFVLYEAPYKWDAGSPTMVWQQLAKTCADTGVELLVLDNVGVIFGGDMWNPTQVRAFIRFFNGEARRLDLAIVMLIHPPKDVSAYFTGSQTWENAPRQFISLEPVDRDLNADELTLRVKNANYTAWNDPLRHEGIGMQWQDGILVGRQNTTRQVLSGYDKAALDGKMLDAVRRGVELGWRIAADPRSPSSMPARLKKQKQWAHVAWDHTLASYERLMVEGKIIKVAVKDVWLVKLPGQQYPGEGTVVSGPWDKKGQAD
jgi:hypothetical protein